MTQFVYVMLIAATLAGWATTKEHQSAPSGTGTQNLEREALKTGGLRAAAAVDGEYVGREMAEEDAVIPSIEALASQSEAVVVGYIEDNVCWLDATGWVILTDYAVRVEQSISGTLQPGSLVTIVVPGGKVRFENGSTAQTSMAGVPPPTNNQRYLFFLYNSYFRRTEGTRPLVAGPEFTPVGRSVGMFLLSNDRRVVSRADPSHPLHRAWSGRGEEALVMSATAAVRLGGR